MQFLHLPPFDARFLYSLPNLHTESRRSRRPASDHTYDPTQWGGQHVIAFFLLNLGWLFALVRLLSKQVARTEIFRARFYWRPRLLEHLPAAPGACLFRAPQRQADANPNAWIYHLFARSNQQRKITRYLLPADPVQIAC